MCSEVWLRGDSRLCQVGNPKRHKELTLRHVGKFHRWWTEDQKRTDPEEITTQEVLEETCLENQSVHRE